MDGTEAFDKLILCDFVNAGSHLQFCRIDNAFRAVQGKQITLLRLGILIASGQGVDGEYRCRLPELLVPDVKYLYISVLRNRQPVGPKAVQLQIPAAGEIVEGI